MGKDMELLTAVKAEDTTAVQRIVSKIKAKQKKQGTIKKSSLNFQDEDGFSALHHAALISNCSIMATLLECNQISVDIKDNKGMRPLHYAAWQGKLQPVSLLMKFGSSPNECSQDSETPLHLASQYGSHMVVDILLQYQANPILRNKKGKTALDLAAEFGRLKVVQRLMNSNQCTALLEFSSRTRVSMHTPLHLAAKNGHIDVMRVLLEYGIDINRETPNGTSLHEAALAGKSEVVKLLIASGIDVHKKNSHGQTALDIVNKFTPSRAAQEVKQLLRDSIGGSQARALQEYSRIHDRSALSFKPGDIITILERNRDGNWKGSITKANIESIGFFPSSYVELLTRPVSTSSLSQQSTFSYASTSPTSTGSSLPTSQYYSYSSTPLSSMPGSVTPPSSNVLVDATNRFSADSTTSASSSGNWSSNRESLDQMHSQPFKPNYYHPAGSNASLSPPPPPPPQPMNGSVPYGIPEDRPFPAAPPDIYHPGHHGYYPQSSSPARNSSEMVAHHYHDGSMVGSPSRGMSGSPHHIPSPTNDQVYHQPLSPQHPMSPRRLQPDTGHQLENGIWTKRGGSGKVYLDNSGEESGIDVSSSTESMEKRSYGGGILTPGNAPNIHMNVNSKPLGHSQPFHSFENVLGDKDPFRVLAGHQRPHSDGSSDIRMDMMRQSDIQPHYQGKDVDRIYEWLRCQRMPEYTNNFTKAGYDMPTIARMTPEDLTAIGVTKPGHRKRISAMIGQMSEPDGIPNYKPHDVVTWLKLLDLLTYHNTFISNNYNTMEAVSEITWEDLQEIGINQLGHQKKFSLAIKRLRDLQKQASRVMASAQQASSVGSDDSTSPHSSSDGVYHHHHHHHHPHHPNTLMLNTPEQQTSPIQSPENTLIKKKSGLRSSQESLGSNGSNKSSGSHGSHEQGYPKKIVHLRQLSESREASYVPTVTNLKVATGNLPEHRQASPEGENATLPSNYQPFSTFKHPPVSTPGGTFKIPAAPRDRKSSESLERVLAAQGNNVDSASSTPKRNSVEGGSSIASSGSGDGSVKMKRAKPPAPPKRTNSVRTMDEEQLKTATIGRKKSLKQFREEMAAGNMSKKVELPEGFATIKRSASRKTPMLKRSSSQDGDNPPGGLAGNFGPPVAPTVPQVQSVVPNAPSQQSHSTFGVNKTDEEIQPQATVSYNAYGISSQPVVTPVQQQPPQQQPSIVSGNGTPSRSVSVPTSPVYMQQHPSWTNQETQGSREPAVSAPSTSGPASTTQKPTVTKPNAALIAEMQKSIALSMLTGPPASSQSTVETTFHSSASSSVVTSSTVQSTTVTNQQANTNIAYNVSSSQRQSDEEQSVFSNETGENHQRSSGGSFKLSQTLPSRSTNRPPSVELLQNTSRRPSSGGFKLGIDVAQEKQIQNRVAQSDVPMREGFHNNSHRPPSTGSTGSGGSGSTDSSSNKPDRPGNMELLWRRMSQETDESAPIIQPVLSKPLEGIWRPKSRHFENGIPGQTEDQNQADFSQEVEVSGQKLQTKATFRSLKKQFLDQNSTPITYHTLKRPPKKPDPNFFEEDFRPRSKSFTDMDEYHQSPVAKNAPVDFETMMAMEDQNAQPQPQSDFDTDAESNHQTSESYPVLNGSPNKNRTQSSPVRTPVPNVGGNHKKPISLPGLVSAHGAQDATSNEASNNTVPSSSYNEQGLTAPSPKVAPKQVPPPQVPPPKVPKPKNQPPQVPPPPSQVLQPKVPSTEVAPLKNSSQKTSPQQMLPPKVSPKAPRLKAPSQIPNSARLEMMPPPPSIEDLPPPQNEDFPLPPPPCQDYDLPPPPDEMGLPPPPPSMETAAPSFTPLSYNNFPPPPPPVQQVPHQQPKQLVAPQTAPKSKPGSSRKKTRTPVVSEGWESNSDTIKRKPSPLTPVSPDKTPESFGTDRPSIDQIPQPQSNESKQNPKVAEKKKSPVKAPVKVPEKSGKSQSRTGKNPVRAPAKKKALVTPPPLDDKDDVDFYSQDLDMMDTLGGQEDLVESDSSDTMESGLTGFENENTDTIKKQPAKLSPAKISEDMNDPEIVGRTLSMEDAAADQQADFIRRRKDNTTSTMKKDRDSQGFGEVSLQLADILNSMGSDDPLANFAANAEASAKARLSPSKPNPPPSYTAPSITQDSAEPKDIFNDIESMFNDLTFDLENMMN